MITLDFLQWLSLFNWLLTVRINIILFWVLWFFYKNVQKFQENYSNITLIDRTSFNINKGGFSPQQSCSDKELDLQKCPSDLTAYHSYIFQWKWFFLNDFKTFHPINLAFSFFEKSQQMHFIPLVKKRKTQKTPNKKTPESKYFVHEFPT